MVEQSKGSGRYHAVLDVVSERGEPGRATGWLEDKRDSRNTHELSASRSEGKWHVYGGDQDQFYGSHPSLHLAVKNMMKSMGESSGSARIGRDSGGDKHHAW